MKRPPIGARDDWTRARVCDAWEACGRPGSFTRAAMQEHARAHRDEPWPSNDDVIRAGGWAALRDALSSSTPSHLVNDAESECALSVEIDVSDLDYDDAETLPGASAQQKAPLPPIAANESDGVIRGKTMLIIPDAHAHPEYDHERFAIMGAFVDDHRPDIITCLGDWWDMPALSSYDKGKRSGECRRARADIDAGAEAMDMFCGPWSGRRYVPEMHFCMGNHEARLDKYANDAPEVEGILGTETLGVAGWGWTVHAFMQPGVRVAGYLASHYHPAGIMGRPIGGVSPARAHFQKMHESSISGHSHVYDVHTESTAAGRISQSIVAGCITHPDDSEGWSLATSRMWRRCIVLVHLRGYGHGDVECWSLDRLTETYGRRAA